MSKFLKFGNTKLVWLTSEKNIFCRFRAIRYRGQKVKKSKKNWFLKKKRDLKKMTKNVSRHSKMLRLSSNLDHMLLIGFLKTSKRGFGIFAFFAEILHILTKKWRFSRQNGNFYAKNAKIKNPLFENFWKNALINHKKMLQLARKLTKLRGFRYLVSI